MKTVELFADGACSGNPGPGGYGTILRYNGVEKEFSGFEAGTTNNRMELTAVIVGLEALKERCNVILTSDSKYVIDALEKGWAIGWQQNNWKRKSKGKALNPDLWERLLKLTNYHNMTYVWIKGHQGHPENERCDAMAVKAYESYKNTFQE